MLTKRIIPCLDIDAGKVVKGVNFEGLQIIGDPVALARRYDAEGADEVVFLDITASHQGRETLLDIIEQAANELQIPLTVGGGMRTLADIRATLQAGADKVSLNSFAILNPDLVQEAASIFGVQCIVGAVDAKFNVDRQAYDVYLKGGRENSGLDLVEWVQKLAQLGAGEILLTSMDADGTKRGFDLAMLEAVTQAVNIPVIASGGCGSVQDIVDVFQSTTVDAALAASIFHYQETTISSVKKAMFEAHIPVRQLY